MLIRPPPDWGRQRLGPVVKIERGQVPPRVVTAGELHHARHEHQFKEKEFEEKQTDPRDRRVSTRSHSPAPRREENREEPRLQQKNVPLETEERLSRDRE